VPLRTGPAPAPVYAPQPYAGAAAPGGAAAAGRGGLPTVLDEKLLKVTLTLDVVKLLPQAQEGGAPQNNPGN
jgi:hypothetical protein